MLQRNCADVESSEQHYRQPTRTNIIPIACWLIVLVINLSFHLSGAEVSFLLRAFEAFVVILATRLKFKSDTSTVELLKLLEYWPKSLDHAHHHFDLNNCTTTYTCCQKCGALSKYDKDTANPVATCAKTVDGRLCATKLFQGKRQGEKVVAIPIKRFHYQSVKDWLLSRRGIEDQMDTAFSAATPSLIVNDVWGGSYVRNFLRHRVPFFSGGDPSKSEGRYLFSLGIDWMTAHSSGPARKAWSIGAIFLVCLNLPKSERFKMENVCLVGILPGPLKTKLGPLHQILDLLVDEFVELWDTGVWYTKTWKHPLGRLVRVALGPVVCDLDASRNVAGFTPFQHELFCAYCLLPLQRIKNFIRSTWPTRDPIRHRVAGHQWQRCTSNNAREEIERELGAKWSPLLRLRYWNPLQCTILDPMHNLLLGLLQRHFREVWGISVTAQGGDGQEVNLGRIPTAEEMARGRHVLRTGTRAALKKLYVHVLKALCLEVGLLEHVGGVSDQIVDALVVWVSEW